MYYPALTLKIEKPFFYFLNTVLTQKITLLLQRKLIKTKQISTFVNCVRPKCAMNRYGSLENSQIHKFYWWTSKYYNQFHIFGIMLFFIILKVCEVTSTMWTEYNPTLATMWIKYQILFDPSNDVDWISEII